jgi:alpha-beta hydrolase superfamily lysophospholipase
LQEIIDFAFIILLIIAFCYGTISLLVFFVLTNNPILWRKGTSKFPFPITLKYSNDNKTAYWIHHQENCKGWVILLHYYVGKSESMAERGNYYINNGYSILFVDGPSHGLSKFSLRATAAHYSTNVLEIIEKEKIKNPILHGVSFGSTACLFLTKMIIYKALVLESSPYLLKNIFWSLFHYIKIPVWLFGWIPHIIFFRYRNFDWERNDPIRLLKFIDAPTLIFHAKKDKIFDHKIHAKIFKKLFQEDNNNYGKFIMVDDTKHTEINQSFLWEENISKIL